MNGAKLLPLQIHGLYEKANISIQNIYFFRKYKHALCARQLCDKCVPQSKQDLQLQDDEFTPVRWTRGYK